ncbi:MAG TPA: ABC transporter permease [Jatrophihabitans sp.]|jgi:peptide/nickel transport system permease protein|uniref:ABC transporter permease n=1 Tax=Jatrophihabitans sp. TaxID=1932789 RepID=UPI002EF32ED4
MIRYIIRRSIGGVLVLLVTSFVTFFIFQVGPKIAGVSPALFYVGKIPPNEEGLRLIEARFGFDLPLWKQYFDWGGGILFGRTLGDDTGATVECAAPCLGYSFRQQLPVSEMIMRALPVELSIALGAAVLWLVGGLTIGSISALKRGSFFDRAAMTMALAAVSLPIFFTGPILLLVFKYKLGWLPNTNYASITSDPEQWLRSMILPWLALAFIFAALYARLTRANMLETMSEDYVRTARAKGLARRTVVVKHGLRAALTPIVTIFGLDLGQLIGSAVITESVFNLPGLGLISIKAINSQDLPVILGVTIVATFAVVVANIIVDIGYAFVDPRVSYS